MEKFNTDSRYIFLGHHNRTLSSIYFPETLERVREIIEELPLTVSYFLFAPNYVLTDEGCVRLRPLNFTYTKKAGVTLNT